MPSTPPVLTNCPKCGVDWIGQQECACGWRPDRKKRMLIKILAPAIVVALVGASYLAVNFHQFFPDESSARIHLGKAEDEFNRRLFPESVAEYRLAAMYSPKNVEIRRGLALALLNDQRPNEALHEIEVAHELRPNDLLIRKELAVLLDQAGQTEKAAKVLEQVIAEDKDESLQFKLADLYSRSDREDEALPIFERYTKTEPRANGAWIAIARIYSKKGDKKKAISVLQEALMKLPNNAALHSELAFRLEDNDQVAEAIDEYRRVVELEPMMEGEVNRRIKRLRQTSAVK